MKSKNNAQLFSILAIVVFLVGAGAIYFKWQDLNAQADQLQAVQAKVDNASGVTQELADSQQRISKLRIQLSHLEKGVPDYAYLPTMLRELERYGKANGVDVTGVRPIASAPAAANPNDPAAATQKSYDELGVEVRGRATYGDVVRFVKALQQFPKIVAVKTVSLNPKQANQLSSDSPLLDAIIELKVFVFSQDPTVDQTASANPDETVTVPPVSSLPSAGQPGAASASPTPPINSAPNAAPHSAPSTVRPSAPSGSNTSVRLEVPNANG